MDLAQLTCPLCGGLFQAQKAWQGQQVACPHCHQAVTVPHLAEPPAELPPEFGTSPPPVEAGETIAIKTDAPADPEPASQVQDAAVGESSLSRRRASAAEAFLDARRQPKPPDEGSPFAVRETERRIVTPRGEQIILRQRSPHERARFRRRLSAAVALVAATILVVVFVVLLNLG